MARRAASPSSSSDGPAGRAGGRTRARGRRLDARRRGHPRTYRLAFVTDPTYAAFAHLARHARDVRPAGPRREDHPHQPGQRGLQRRPRHQVRAGRRHRHQAQPATRRGDERAQRPVRANACFAAGPTGGPTTAATCLLDRNDFVLGQLVGADNFDIGHIGLGVNGGGIAGLGVVGGATRPTGCTGLPDSRPGLLRDRLRGPRDGPPDGWQPHLQRHPGQLLAAATATPDTSVEPGSGSSIMAYAGICEDNLQPHSDPYFSFSAASTRSRRPRRQRPRTVDRAAVVNLASFDGTRLVHASPARAAPTSGTVTTAPTYTAAAARAARSSR